LILGGHSREGEKAFTEIQFRTSNFPLVPRPKVFIGLGVRSRQGVLKLVVMGIELGRGRARGTERGSSIAAFFVHFLSRRIPGPTQTVLRGHIYRVLLELLLDLGVAANSKARAMPSIYPTPLRSFAEDRSQIPSRTSSRSAIQTLSAPVSGPGIKKNCENQGSDRSPAFPAIWAPRRCSRRRNGKGPFFEAPSAIPDADGDAAKCSFG